MTTAPSLLGYLRPHRRAATVLVVALVIATALPLAGPQLLRRFVDEAISGAPLSSLLTIAVGYLVVTLSARAVDVLATYRASHLAWTATNTLREDLAEHLLGLDLAFHAQHTAGELIERVDGDVFKLSEFLSRYVLRVVAGLLLLVGVVVLVWVEDVRLGALLTGFVVVAGWTIYRLQLRAVPAAAREREAQAQLLGGLEERLAGADDIRALGAGPHVLVRFRDSSIHAFRASLRWHVISGGLFAVTNLVFAGGTALMLAAGIALWSRDAITVGTVLLLLQYTTMLRQPLEQIIGQFKEFQEAAAGAGRVRDLLSLRPAIVEAEHPVRLPESGPLSLRLNSVTFAYPDDDDVMHDVDLTLEPGRSLGLVGRTGSGKTTIARLLLRLYDPTAGSVEVGGIDLRDASLASLRSRVRLVTQDVQVFGTTVRDNVTLFGSDVDDSDVVAVLEELGLGNWLRSLPGGIDTVLGPGGSGVSAGEGQLLAFARVFLADPGLVVLDEPTSRLDPATEALIDRALVRLLSNRTAVVIAHRLSSLERMDEIAVVDHGRIVEHGARSDLASDPTSRFARLLGSAVASR